MVAKKKKRLSLILLANTGNNCSGYELTSCPSHGSCSSCPFNRKYKRLISCTSGYTKNGNSCSASSCSAIGYDTSIPANKTCTKVTEGSLTCYKDCKPVSCSGYTLSCDSFNVANSAAKATCPDCDSANANCSPKLCKVSSCLDGFKIADNGTACVALDDNCPDGYFKECETGTQGDPKYTEKGTACYLCKAKSFPSSVGDILYSDLTTSPDVIPGKTPIGIISYKNGNNYQALNLDQYNGHWTNSRTDNSCIPNTESPASDFNGQDYTNCVRDDKSSYPIFKYCIDYSTAGTQAGQWYLPAAGEMQRVFNNISSINSVLALLNKKQIANEQAGTIYGGKYDYWSSSEHNSAHGWRYSITDKTWYESGKDTGNHGTRCVINLVKCGSSDNQLCFENENKGLPILYSDMSVSTEVDFSKTPIGIVIEPTKRIAMALETTRRSSWSKIAHGSIDGVFSTNDAAEALSDMDGQTNTYSLAAYCLSGLTSKQCSSLQDVLDYSTEGTEPADWYFSSLGELNLIYQLKDSINATLALIGRAPLENTWYWSSTRDNAGYPNDGSWYIHFGQNDGMPQRTNFATVMSKIPLIKYPSNMDLMCIDLARNNRARFCGGIDPYQGNVGNYPYCIPTMAVGGSTSYAGALNNGHTCWTCEPGYRFHCNTNSPSVEYCDAYENGKCITCYKGTLTDGKCI